jgi:molecular chaperone DnaK
VPYRLAVDLGTTFTAAAVQRDGRIEMAPLGDRATALPSLLYAVPDGGFLAGEAAARRALVEPERVASEFKRRFGDPTPIVLGGAPFGADALLAELLRAVLDRVQRMQGELPEGVVLTHPANWGPYKLELFSQVPRLAGLEGAQTLAEPVAAALHYAANERVDPGATVAVYDLGGGTFDATVLRRVDAAFEILGTPEGIERLGGIDLDEAVFAHVRRSLDGAIERIDPEDGHTMAALVRLREECVLAKEALSADTEAVIPVLLPALQTEVRLTRGELEEMVRPPLEATIDALRRALRSAQVEPAELSAVLLVGGSSRIPLVGRLVSAALDRPVAVDAHPKHAVALGAASAHAPSPCVGEGRGEVVGLPTLADEDRDEVAPKPAPPALTKVGGLRLPSTLTGSRGGRIGATVLAALAVLGATATMPGSRAEVQSLLAHLSRPRAAAPAPSMTPRPRLQPSTPVQPAPGGPALAQGGSGPVQVQVQPAPGSEGRVAAPTTRSSATPPPASATPVLVTPAAPATGPAPPPRTSSPPAPTPVTGSPSPAATPATAARTPPPVPTPCPIIPKNARPACPGG